ncbi:MAG TPA: hypothetical protein IAC45_05060 [Candidatus Aphodousia faecavium]|nr:hypothetical protein [Candidatus Aphodousia faecavium]
MWQMELDFSQPVQTPNPAVQASIAEAVQKATANRPQLNRDGSRKLEDFGEDLGNTRKGRKYGDRIGNLEGLRERLAKEPLEKLWPKESILKMENSQAAAMLWFARNLMPNRRPMKQFQLQRYLNRGEAFIRFQQGIESGTLTTDQLIDVSPKIIDLVYDLQTPAKFLAVTDRKFWNHVTPGYFRDFNDMCRWNGWDMPENIDPLDGKMRILMPAFNTPKELTFHGYKLIEGSSWEEIGQAINAHLGAQFLQKDSAEAKPVQKPVQFATQKLDSSHYRIYGRRGTIDVPLMEMEAKTREEVVAYIRSHTDELSAKYELIRTELSRDEFSYKPKLIRDRVGTDWRGGKDVTPEQFEQVFGFRGVEFGNWVNQGKNSRERQWMLNNAFDAFNDLAEALNLPPKAMALDGTLGLAFGSRGHGKASAHYEPVAHVINLTKTKGYSSLAHEWFHALDHYIASTNSNDLQAFQSNFGKPRYKLKPETIERLKTSIESEYLQSACQSLENNINELFVSIFRNKDTVNRYIYGVSEDGRHSKNFKVEVSKDDLMPEYPDLLRTTIRPELYHAWRETIEAIRSTRMSERTRERAVKKGKAESSIEDDYWYSKIEQAARSFEGYVEAKLTKEGKISDFLTFGSYSDKPIENDGTKFFPYLDGDDVERVSEKFAKVFDVLKTRQTQKGVMLFSKLVGETEGLSSKQLRSELSKQLGTDTLHNLEKSGFLRLSENVNDAYVQAMIGRAIKLGKAQVFEHPYDDSTVDEYRLTASEILSLDSAQGFFDSVLDSSFLVASNLSADTAYPALLHEVGVHMAHDSILHDQFAPVIDQAVQIVNDGLAQNDPLAQAVKKRLNLSGISSEDENYKEEVCAHLVEEVAKQELQKPQVIQWFNKVKSTVNTWLVEHGWKDAESLSATDIATIAKNNVRELSKLKLEQAFTLVPEGAQKADLMLSKGQTFPVDYQEQKSLLDKPMNGKFIVEGYAEVNTFDCVELGSNISLREAIKEAKYLYGDRELDNLAFVAPDGSQEIQIDEFLARETASQIALEPKLPANKTALAEFKEIAEAMGNDLTERILNPVMASIMDADRKGIEYRHKNDNRHAESKEQKEKLFRSLHL